MYLMIGISLAILSAISLGMVPVFSKKLLEILDSWNSIIYGNFFMVIIAFFYALIAGFSFSFSAGVLVVILINGVIGFLGLYCLYESFKYLKLGESLSIANTYPFITLLLLGFIGSSIISMTEIFFMLLLLVGVYLVVNHHLTITFNKGILLALVATTAWGFYSFAIAYLLREGFNFSSTILMLELFILICCFLYVTLTNKLKPITKEITKKASLLGLFNGVGTLLLASSIVYLNAGIASSISTASVLITALFGYLVFKEKLTKIQMIGIFIIIFSLTMFYLV